MSSRVVNVEIHGQKYAIRSELEPQYILTLAEYLDAKMQVAARETATIDPARVAVVAAINILDELFHARQDAVAAEGTLLSRTIQIERIVDAVLDEARARVVNE
jgi:cell division protein ZapA (FtsZ GTPase activity inhibitor)